MSDTDRIVSTGADHSAAPAPPSFAATAGEGGMYLADAVSIVDIAEKHGVIDAVLREILSRKAARSDGGFRRASATGLRARIAEGGAGVDVLDPNRPGQVYEIDRRIFDGAGGLAFWIRQLAEKTWVTKETLYDVAVVVIQHLNAQGDGAR